MNYKLTYWDLRGRAEPIRIIFAAAKVKYEDNRIKKSTWPSLKPSMPWNQVPVLQVGEKILAQSLTICRFLAQEFNLVGSNSWDAAKCDEYADAITDLVPEMKRIAHEKDEETKAKLRIEFKATTLPRYLEKFKKILEESGGPFLLGDKLTWVDIYVSTIVDRIVEGPCSVPEEFLKKYPRVILMRNSTYAYPGIKEWIESRPDE